MNDPELEQVMELIRREMKDRGTAAVLVTESHTALQTWSEPVTPGQTRVLRDTDGLE